MKKKKQPEKQVIEESAEERIEKYANAPYFNKKDKQAIEFLKKHPIPKKFLK